jgi:hypothetical protein
MLGSRGETRCPTGRLVVDDTQPVGKVYPSLPASAGRGMLSTVMSVLRRMSVALAAATLMALGGCSAEANPPQLSDCTAVGDASCSDPHVVGGAVGGENDSGLDDTGSVAAGCNAGPFASQCDVCANANCCMQLSTCAAPTVCSYLLSCVDGCVDSTCVSACEAHYPTGVTMFNDLDACENLKCPICNESGIGDPCAPGNPACVAGLTCNGLWCTRSCNVATNCAGVGPAGGNFIGEPGVCVATIGAPSCAPGCTTTNDCVNFPSTNCLSTMSVDGTTTLVCSIVDAG